MNFYLKGFQKLKKSNHLLDDSRKSENSRKKHPKKNHKSQKVIELKVPIFVGGVKFLAIYLYEGGHIFFKYHGRRSAGQT